MTDERDTPGEGFLSRWSRVKTQAREAAAAPPPLPEEAKTEEAPPDLPPVEQLTIESDFKPFFHPKVEEDVRRSALRKLFSDPHFNVMDGLDVYIDDYSKSESIPPAMLAGLQQARRILDWAAEDKEAIEARERARLAGHPPETALPAAAAEAETPAAQPSSNHGTAHADRSPSSET